MDAVTVVGGGSGGVSVEAALARYGSRLAAVRFGARAKLGAGGVSEESALRQILLSGRLVAAGVRSGDLAGRECIAADGTRVLGAAELEDRPEVLGEAVAATGAEAIHVHIELDVLDPAVFAAVARPVPGGLLPDRLAAAVAALADGWTLAGLSVSGYLAPGTATERAALAGLSEGLGRALRRPGTATQRRAVETAAARAWPARRAELQPEGWLLRHTPGVTRRRSNTALPWNDGPDGRPAEAADAVERRSRELGLQPAWQLSPAEEHQVLDAELAARGYRRDAPTLVLTAPARRIRPSLPTAPADLEIEVAEHPGDAWSAAFEAMDGHEDSSTVLAQVLTRIPAPAGYALARAGGRAVGTALFAGESGDTVLLSLATDPAHRRRGIGSALMLAAADFAERHGTGRIHLQVEAGNEVARRMYTRLGFGWSHSYHYRMAV